VTGSRVKKNRQGTIEAGYLQNKELPVRGNIARGGISCEGATNRRVGADRQKMVSKQGRQCRLTIAKKEKGGGEIRSIGEQKACVRDRGHKRAEQEIPASGKNPKMRELTFLHLEDTPQI